VKRFPLFVDRIVATIAEPEGLRKQVEAITSLATSAAGEAKRRLIAAAGSPDDPKCVQLVSAVLGAYVSRYSATLQEDNETVVVPAMQLKFCFSSNLLSPKGCRMSPSQLSTNN
jgi:hypothetical protein